MFIVLNFVYLLENGMAKSLRIFSSFMSGPFVHTSYIERDSYMDAI